MSEKRCLLISSIGIGLFPVRYAVPRQVGGARHGGFDAVETCCGIGAFQPFLGADDPDVDVLLLTTSATEPRGDAVEVRPEGALTAVERVKDDLAAVREKLGLEAPVRVHSHWLDWESSTSVNLVQELVALPGKLEGTLRTALESAWDDYDLICIDVAAGLRPLGVGLWLMFCYLREAKPLRDKTLAVYAELEQANRPIWFPADRRKPALKPELGIVGEPARERPMAVGRLFDLTPFFDSIAGTIAVSHLVERLDFRSATEFVRNVTQHDVPLNADVTRFAEAAQLGLDIEAAAYAREALASGWRGGGGDQGSEALATLLRKQMNTIAREWAAREVRVDPKKAKKDGEQSFKSGPLDAGEIVRHARVIERFWKHGRLADASLHMRELVVSAMQLANGDSSRWCDTRRAMDRRFGALSFLARSPALLAARSGISETQSEDITRSPLALCTLVEKLQSARNALAHAGRQREETRAADLRADLAHVWERVSPPTSPEQVPVWLQGWPSLALRVSRPSGPPVLVAPLPLKQDAAVLSAALAFAKRELPQDFRVLLLATNQALEEAEILPTDDALTRGWFGRAVASADVDVLLAEPIRVAWHTTKPSGGLAEQSTITTLAGGEATPEQIERARLVVVCMGDGAPPESRKAEKLVAQVTGALPRLTGLANKVIRSDAGATSYQSLVLGLVEGALKQTGSLPEHWIITKAADHPGALRAPHDWTGVRRTVDGGKDEQAPPFPHAEQPRGFVNVSNHPSDSWSPEQTQAALELGLGEVWDWPGGFPAVAPVAAGDEVSGFARELSSRIVGERPAGAFVSGEFALTAALVQRLREAGVRCFCATTERDVRDELVEGALRKVSRFRFVRWREFV